MGESVPGSAARQKIEVQSPDYTSIFLFTHSPAAMQKLPYLFSSTTGLPSI